MLFQQGCPYTGSFQGGLEDPKIPVPALYFKTITETNLGIRTK